MLTGSQNFKLYPFKTNVIHVGNVNTYHIFKMKIEFCYKIIKESGNDPSKLLDLLIKNKFALYDLRSENEKITKEELLEKYSKNIGATDIFCVRE